MQITYDLEDGWTQVIVDTTTQMATLMFGPRDHRGTVTLFFSTIEEIAEVVSKHAAARAELDSEALSTQINHEVQS